MIESIKFNYILCVVHYNFELYLKNDEEPICGKIIETSDGYRKVEFYFEEDLIEEFGDLKVAMLKDEILKLFDKNKD